MQPYTLENVSWKNASVYYKDVLILIRETTSVVEWKLRLVFPIITKLRDTFDIWLTWAEGFSGNISSVPHRHHPCCFRCRHRWPQSQLFIISKNKQIEVIKSPLSYSSKIWKTYLSYFISPELKAHVKISDQNLSFNCLS